MNFKQFLKDHTGTKYLQGSSYNGAIPEIKFLPVSAIERPLAQDGQEVLTVSDSVAKNMDFSEPVEVTAFRFGSDNDEHKPVVSLDNGHHRVAAALQTDRRWLPVVVRARNAKGEKILALIQLSDQIQNRDERWIEV